MPRKRVITWGSLIDRFIMEKDIEGLSETDNPLLDGICCKVSPDGRQMCVLDRDHTSPCGFEQDEIHGCEPCRVPGCGGWC